MPHQKKTGATKKMRPKKLRSKKTNTENLDHLSVWIVEWYLQGNRHANAHVSPPPSTKKMLYFLRDRPSNFSLQHMHGIHFL